MAVSAFHDAGRSRAASRVGNVKKAFSINLFDNQMHSVKRKRQLSTDTKINWTAVRKSSGACDPCRRKKIRVSITHPFRKCNMLKSCQCIHALVSPGVAKTADAEKKNYSDISNLYDSGSTQITPNYALSFQIPYEFEPSLGTSSMYADDSGSIQGMSSIETDANSIRAYTTPSREKLLCQKCNIKPEGYRGPHELRRHMDVMHPSTARKAFVCVDRSADKKFLANCRHCQMRKKYHAEYNAAAHLRRIHFHPRVKGDKDQKEASSRGGSAGGDRPKLEVLRLWIEEVEEVVADVLVENGDQATAGDDDMLTDEADNDNNALVASLQRMKSIE